jgi:hypothetical protein
MKLDRNINTSGLGKYRLWDERKQAWVDDCAPGDEHEFFVVMLKDRHALPAVAAYAASITHVDTEFAAEVRD